MLPEFRLLPDSVSTSTVPICFIYSNAILYALTLSMHPTFEFPERVSQGVQYRLVWSVFEPRHIIGPAHYELQDGFSTQQKERGHLGGTPIMSLKGTVYQAQQTWCYP